MLKRRTSSSEPDAVGGAGVVAQVDRRLVGQPAQDLAQDGQAAYSRVEDANGTRVGHGLSVSPRRRRRGRRSSAAARRTSAAHRGVRAGDDERHALVVRLDDESPVGDDLEVRPAAERSRQLVPVDAAARVGPVDQVVDLLGRVADRGEDLGHGDRVVDRRRVVGDDREDDVADASRNASVTSDERRSACRSRWPRTAGAGARSSSRRRGR